MDREAGRLTGRGALVTGASRRAGIGYAIANRLEELGASVFRHGFSAHDEAQPWGAEPRVDHLDADLADPNAPAAVMAGARRGLGHVDVLVANHARSGHGTLEELTAAELDGFLAVNVRATQAAANAAHRASKKLPRRWYAAKPASANTARRTSPGYG